MNTPAGRILYAAQRPDGGTPYWRMETIWAAAAGRPAISIAIENLDILDAVVWFGGPKNVQPTIRKIAEHARDIFNADLTYPIIMTRSGEVLDGAHRIAKAHLQGLLSIATIVLDDWPPPDGVIQVSPSHGRTNEIG